MEALVEQRFWTKVNKNGPLILKTQCWVWTAGTDQEYGCFWDGQKIGAHRFSYKRSKGLIPHGMFVCHRCDNPPCVNPEHLFLGTQKDNMEDCAAKKRLSVGEERPHSKLTEKQVSDIRSRESYWGITVALAKEFHVGQSTISDIRRKKIWR